MTAPDAHPTAFGDVAPPAPLPPLPPPAADALAPDAGFVRLPRAVLRAPGLSVLARLLYATLLDYARQDGYCWPRTDRLRADLGCGHNQLARATRELEAAGLVVRRRRGFGRPTVYTLPPLPGTPGPARSPVRRALPARSVDVLPCPSTRQSPPPATGRPPYPDPAAQPHPKQGLQTAPDRVPQDLEAGDRDAKDQHPSAPAPRSSPPGTRAQRVGVVARLVEQGVTPGVAQDLAARYAPEVVERQLACHGHRVATGAITQNPAGALVRAIRQDWAPPPAWTAGQQRAAAQARQAEEETHRREAEADRVRAWALKPPEERIAGRLQFWVLGQRAKRREPTATEIAARRAELLAELAAPDRGPTRRPASGVVA